MDAPKVQRMFSVTISVLLEKKPDLQLIVYVCWKDSTKYGVIGIE